MKWPRFRFGDFERDQVIILLDRLAFAALVVGVIILLYFLFMH